MTDAEERIQRLEAENHELRTTLEMIRRGFATYAYNISVIIHQAIGDQGLHIQPGPTGDAS